MVHAFVRDLPGQCPADDSIEHHTRQHLQQLDRDTVHIQRMAFHRAEQLKEVPALVSRLGRQQAPHRAVEGTLFVDFHTGIDHGTQQDKKADVHSQQGDLQLHQRVALGHGVQQPGQGHQGQQQLHGPEPEPFPVLERVAERQRRAPPQHRPKKHMPADNDHSTPPR